jgi:hypothetical protein
LPILPIGLLDIGLVQHHPRKPIRLRVRGHWKRKFVSVSCAPIIAVKSWLFLAGIANAASRHKMGMVPLIERSSYNGFKTMICFSEIQFVTS